MLKDIQLWESALAGSSHSVRMLFDVCETESISVHKATDLSLMIQEHFGNPKLWTGADFLSKVLANLAQSCDEQSWIQSAHSPEESLQTQEKTQTINFSILTSWRTWRTSIFICLAGSWRQEVTLKPLNIGKWRNKCRVVRKKSSRLIFSVSFCSFFFFCAHPPVKHGGGSISRLSDLSDVFLTDLAGHQRCLKCSWYEKLVFKAIVTSQVHVSQ